MKKLCLLLTLLMMLGMAACAVPASDDSASAAWETASPAPAPTTAQDAIAAASADELWEMITQYQAEDDSEMVYIAAKRLIELDPSDTDAYTAAMDALLAMSGSDIEEINRLLALGGGSAQDVKTLAEWAKQHQPDYTIDIPFSPDYAAESEINKEGITAGNLTNAIHYNGAWIGGFLTSQGGWVYLSRLDEDFAVYKMRADGSEYQRVGDLCGTSLNVIGDWLYYINNSDGCKPYKMRTDGSMKTKLNDDGCEFLSVSSEWMYYSNLSDGGCLYKAKTDGSDKKKLTDYIVISPCVSGDWVYYCEKKPDNAGFCRVSVDGGKPQTIMAANMGNYCIEDDWIYYNSGDTICRVHTDGSGKEVFFQLPETITTFNIAAGILYVSGGLKYENDGYAIGIRIIAIDMDDMVEFMQKFDFNTEPICTGPDGWIYFMDDNEGLAWYSMNIESGDIKKLG